MINKIDDFYITKTINLKDTFEELQLLHATGRKWAEDNGYRDYMLKPTFTIIDKVKGFVSYSVEVVEYVKD